AVVRELEPATTDPAPVIAAGAAPRRPVRTNGTTPPRHQPRPPTATDAAVIQDRRSGPGATFADATAVALALIDAAAPGRGPDGDMVTVASIDRSWLYGSDRRITNASGSDHISAVL